MSKDIGDAERFVVEAALGRIFSMLSRPARPGDAEDYERCRAAALDVVGAEGRLSGWGVGLVHCWQRDGRVR